MAWYTYTATVPPFGDVPFVAESMTDARTRARRMFGRRVPVARVRTYRHCSNCQSAPCECPRARRNRS